MSLKQKLRDYFCPEARIIVQKAAVYDRVSWYRSLRFVPVFLWTLWATGLTVYEIESVEEKWNFMCGMVITMLPLIYLGVKGYRWVLLFEVLYIVGNQIGGLWQYGFQDWSVVVVPVITALFVFPLVTAFRIENYRVKNKTAPKRKFWIDILKALLVTLLATLLVTGVLLLRQSVMLDREIKASGDLMERYAEIFIHTDGVEKYCQEYGVELKKYPQRFRKDYAAQIAEINRQLEQSAFLKLVIQKANDEIFRHGLAERYDRFRKGVIVMQLRKERNIPAGEFVWKDEYYGLMDRAGYCRFLDDNYDLFKKVWHFEILNRD